MDLASAVDSPGQIAGTLAHFGDIAVDRVSLLERPLTDGHQAADGDADLKITFLMD